MATRGLHILLVYIAISFVHPILIAGYLAFSDLSGGEVGMLPILILLLGFVTTGGAALVLLLLHLFRVLPNYSWAVVIYFVIYFLGIGSEYLNSLLSENWSHPGTQLAFWLIIIGLVVMYLGILFARLLERSAKRAEAGKETI